jgi:hypothetical protein
MHRAYLHFKYQGEHKMLKHRITVLLMVTALIASCGISSLTGSGNVVTQEEAYIDFDRLEVSHGFKVEVQQGDGFSVVIRADDNLMDEVKVTKRGDSLSIGLEPGRSYGIINGTLEADITMPELSGLDLSGGSHVTLDDFSMSNAFSADMSGGSHLKGEIDAGDATFDVSGGSWVTLNGSAGDVRVNASGGSHAELGELAVADANVDASGGSHITVNPSDTLDADASGGSHIRYLGSPNMGTIDVDGASSIKAE